MSPPATTVPPTAACGGPASLTLSAMPLPISDGPGDYAPSITCTWVVRAAEPVTLRFSEFRTEQEYDVVLVYDGASTSSALLASYSGSSLPAAVTSTGSALTVVFLSDSSVSDTGFLATASTASIDAPLTLVGTVPAALGNLQCIGRVVHM